MLPQNPQFVESVAVFAQLDSHFVSLPAQVEEHLPCVHTWPPVHTVPQVPQLLPSPMVLTQLAPQAVRPPVHWHAPAEQLWPVAQALPHMPQLRLSEAMSMQAVPHATRPVGQVVVPPVPSIPPLLPLWPPVPPVALTAPPPLEQLAITNKTPLMPKKPN